MIRWTSVALCLSCMVMPVLAQVAKSPDTARQAHASPPGSNDQNAAEPTDTDSSTIVYPLDSFRDFSAIMIGSRAERGQGTSQGHIYRSGDKLRMEEPGALAYFITDLTLGETYGILETGCMHDDHPYFRALPFYFAGKAEATVTRTPAGKETVDGHSCQVEEITVSTPMLPSPQKMRFWEAEDLQLFPIKIEFVLPGGHGPMIRYRDVVLGPQDPTLFIHPKSCQPLPQEPTAPSPDKKPPAR